MSWSDSEIKFNTDYNIESTLSLSLVNMMRDVIIPQIYRLRNFEPLREALRFEIFQRLPDGAPDFILDFSDIVSSDLSTDAFKTKCVFLVLLAALAYLTNIYISSFVLPPRSEMWQSTLLPRSSVSLTVLAPTSQSITALKDAVSIISPITLQKNPSVSITAKKRQEWTKWARVNANAAAVATSLEDLQKKVNNFLLVYFLSAYILSLVQIQALDAGGGVCKEGSYVKIPSSLIKE